MQRTMMGMKESTRRRAATWFDLRQRTAENVRFFFAHTINEGRFAHARSTGGLGEANFRKQARTQHVRCIDS